jgi:tryptophanyl-tRNA synthetase
MPVTTHNVESVFTFREPDPQQVVSLGIVRASAQSFANVLLDNVPQCADQQAALRLLREAVMTAHAAILLHGEV